MIYSDRTSISKSRLPAITACVSIALGACGGGGGSAGTPAPVDFTISGQVSGLVSGQRVILRNNGTDPLTMAANGAFTFSTALASGSDYSITIDSQPTGGICTVSAGAGTNIHANIASVLVACTPSTYTVSGVLAGLAIGQQVTVQNNGTDALTLVANGTFTFSTPIEFGSDYGITVTGQPDPSAQQYCSVSNDSGKVSGAVTNAKVACNTEVILHGFASTDAANGLHPYAGLTADGNGNLYGTTGAGGAFNAGTVFQLTPSGNGTYTQSILYSFPGVAGGDGGTDPSGPLMLDSAGNLYGTTTSGGINHSGVVYRLSPASGGGYVASVLHAFGGTSAEGSQPLGELAMDSLGNLYGVNSAGGLYNGGTVFKLSPAAGGTYALSILYTFTAGLDGDTPPAGVIIDGAGVLYGTTSRSRLPGYTGAAYSLKPNLDGSYTERTLHSFGGVQDGSTPMAGLYMDSAGDLYGTTQFGNGNFGAGNGSVFRITNIASGTPSTTEIYSFTGGSDGFTPLGGVIMDGSGNLYGTTSNGGSTNCTNGCGTIYKLTPSGTGYTKSLLLPLPGGSGGSAPLGNLIMDAQGNLFGTTYYNQGAGAPGTIDSGIVFEILLP
jgi:uncharacterized repeat protein (TIGR03803 family)